MAQPSAHFPNVISCMFSPTISLYIYIYIYVYMDPTQIAATANLMSIPPLQGSVEMEPAPAPEDELESILALERMQRIYLTALIADMSPTRLETTAYGQKDIVDVTFVDGSKQEGQEEQVKAPLQTVPRRSRASRTCMRRAQLWLCMD